MERKGGREDRREEERKMREKNERKNKKEKERKKGTALTITSQSVSPHLRQSHYFYSL